MEKGKSVVPYFTDRCRVRSPRLVAGAHRGLNDIQTSGKILDFPNRDSLSDESVLEHIAACQRYWSAWDFDRIEMEVETIDHTWPLGDVGSVSERVTGKLSGQCLSLKGWLRGEDKFTRLGRLRVYDVEYGGSYYGVLGDLIVPALLQELDGTLVAMAIAACLVQDVVPIWAVGGSSARAEAFGFSHDQITIDSHPLFLELSKRGSVCRFDWTSLPKYQVIARAIHAGGGLTLRAEPKNPIPIRLGRRLKGTIAAFLSNLDRY